MSTGVWHALPGAMALVLAGCTTTTVIGQPGIAHGAGDAPPFPECEAAAYVFAGEATLEQLGLAGEWPEQANRVGEIWITAVPPEHFGPPGAPPPGHNVMCVEFPDGSGMAGPVPPGWEPPGAITAEASSSPALGAIGIALVVIVLLGGSLLAFRRA